MIKKFIIGLAFLAIPAISSAQATATAKLDWDQVAGSLAEANTYTYKYYPDLASTGIVLTVVCTGPTSPYLCEAPFPAFTPGAHTLTATSGNVAGESLKSTPLNFTFVVIPSPPTNLRIR